jgi:imidazole glycerol-phosphate synthase subunit HisH
MPEVTVIDYGVGNLWSVQRALEKIGAEVILSSDPKIILKSSRVVLPGVGAFPSAVSALQELELTSTLKDFAKSSKPMLAICLGMQLLMDESSEFVKTRGLGIIPGAVASLPAESINGNKQNIPHIGWNSIQESPESSHWISDLVRRNKPYQSVYFAHSYVTQTINHEHQIAFADYGGHKFDAVIAKNNVTGCQFHPEKSGKFGLQILEGFMST